MKLTKQINNQAKLSFSLSLSLVANAPLALESQ